MSDETPLTHTDTDIPENKPAPRFMVQAENDSQWILVRFEYDLGEGQGLQWQLNLSLGDSIDNIKQHFVSKGFELLPFDIGLQ